MEENNRMTAIHLISVVRTLMVLGKVLIVAHKEMEPNIPGRLAVRTENYHMWAQSILFACHTAIHLFQE